MQHSPEPSALTADGYRALLAECERITSITARADDLLGGIDRHTGEPDDLPEWEPEAAAEVLIALVDTVPAFVTAVRRLIETGYPW